MAAGSSTNRTAAIKLQIKQLKKQYYKSAGVVRWYKTEGKWALRRHEEKCWDAPAIDWVPVCTKARRLLRKHDERKPRLLARIQQLKVLLLPVGNVSHWLCIYSHEHGTGGWATNTGNGYYGGLQMDLDFQRAHGLDLLLRKGTANNWAPREQMVVAQRAHDGIRTSMSNGRVVYWRDSRRGYHPWPNTARMCGLI